MSVKKVSILTFFFLLILTIVFISLYDFSESNQVSSQAVFQDRKPTIKLEKQIIVNKKAILDTHSTNPTSDAQTDINFSLLMAIQSHDVDEVKRLLEAGADVNARNKEGLSLLMIALAESNRNMVDLLIEYGANVFDSVFVHEEEQNVLLFAMYGHQTLDTIEMLREMGVMFPEKQISYAILAITNDYDSLYPELIHPDNISKAILISEGDRKTLIDLAIYKENPEQTLQYLIEQGAQPNPYHKKQGTMNEVQTIVAQQGSVKTLEKIIELGADINYQDKTSGMTPLMLAMASVKTDLVIGLLDAGADKHLVNHKTGDTIEDYLKMIDSEEIRQKYREILSRYP